MTPTSIVMTTISTPLLAGDGSFRYFAYASLNPAYPS